MKKLIFLLLTLSTWAFAAPPPPIIWNNPFSLILQPGLQFSGVNGSAACAAATAGSIRYNSGTFEGCNGTSWASLGGGGSGTVTSVAMTVPTFLSVSGSPITTSGTLAVSLSGTALPVANGGTGLTTPGTSGNVLTSNGTSWVSSGASAGAISGLTAAIGTNTFDNSNFAQEWQWNTLTSQTGLKLSSSGTGITGNLAQITTTGDNLAITGSLLNLTANGTSSLAVPLTISNSNSSSSSKLIQLNPTMLAINATTGNGKFLNFTRSSNNGDGNIIAITDPTVANSDETMINLNYTAGGGVQTGISINTSSTFVFTGYSVNATSGAGAAHKGFYANMTGTAGGILAADMNSAGAGTTIRSTNTGTGYAYDGLATGSGLKGLASLKNTVAAANNSASAIDFYNNRTTSGQTLVAQVAGMITDITDTAYKGALVFYTANNAAPSEHMRIDSKGHIVLTGTAPAVSSCGTGASISGNDNVGKVVTGTSTGATCTVTFASAWGTAPSCFINDESAILATNASSTTTVLTISTSVALGDGATLDYRCVGF